MAYKYVPRELKPFSPLADNKKASGDSFVNPEIPQLKLKDGDYTLRILPPTWKDAAHYAFQAFIHYKVGPQEGAYLCLSKMKNERCPVCEKQAKVLKESSWEEAKGFKPSEKYLMYVIDRADPTMPKLFFCPPKNAANILNISRVKKTNSTLFIEHVTEGYDVLFERVPKNEKNMYPTIQAEQIDRDKTPLGTEEEIEKWMTWAEANPIPDILIYYPYEYIKAKLEGGAVKKVDVEHKHVPTTSDTVEHPLLKASEILDGLKYKQEVFKLSRDDMEEACLGLGLEKVSLTGLADKDLADIILESVGNKLLDAPPKPVTTQALPNLADIKEKLKAKIAANKAGG